MIGGRSYDSDDSDFATAVAASAYAILSIDEATSDQLRIRTENTQKQDSYRLPQGGSIRKKPSIQEDTRRGPSFMRPALSFADHQRQKQPSTELRLSDAKADSWEKAQIAKIRKRYEKMQSEILAWENEKKLKEKHQIERKKGELELRKSRNMKHYKRKVARIEEIGGGARAQVEEKRKQQESIVKNKAREMRSTGKTPVINYFFCF